MVETSVSKLGRAEVLALASIDVISSGHLDPSHPSLQTVFRQSQFLPPSTSQVNFLHPHSRGHKSHFYQHSRRFPPKEKKNQHLTAIGGSKGKRNGIKKKKKKQTPTTWPPQHHPRDQNNNNHHQPTSSSSTQPLSSSALSSPSSPQQQPAPATTRTTPPPPSPAHPNHPQR